MSGPRNSRFLDMVALAALEHMRFTTRHHIEGAYSGRHQSRQQGGVGEFVDFREYSGSEDLRRLDWKVLARTDKAFVRLYQDETNLLCTLAIDASGSMRFGGRNSGSTTVDVTVTGSAVASPIAAASVVPASGVSTCGASIAVEETTVAGRPASDPSSGETPIRKPSEGSQKPSASTTSTPASSAPAP